MGSALASYFVQPLFGHAKQGSMSFESYLTKACSQPGAPENEGPPRVRSVPPRVASRESKGSEVAGLLHATVAFPKPLAESVTAKTPPTLWQVALKSTAAMPNLYPAISPGKGFVFTSPGARLRANCASSRGIRITTNRADVTK